MSDVQNKEIAASGKKPRQGRSPGFPFISLAKALERIDAIRIAEGGRPKHFAPIASACKVWGMGVKTGPGIQTVAALGHFGLCEFEGAGENRRLRPTDLAVRILLDKQPISAERDELIKRAALTPNIHKELWEKWGPEFPSDHTFETYLILERGFSETGARDLIAEYKATIAFAKLDQPDNIAASKIGEEAVMQEREPSQTRFSIPEQSPLRYPVAAAAALGEPRAQIAIYETEAGSRLSITADVDLKGAKALLKKLNSRINLMEEEAAEPTPTGQ